MALALPVAPILMTADTYLYFGSIFSPQWGIFQNGTPIITADSVASMEYRQEWLLSDFPVERGGFETYDKVYVPYQVRFRFTAGGSESNRQALLDSVAAVAGDLNLYDAASPEAIYINCNITHYDYRRTAVNGVGLIQVDVWLEEVRIVGSTNSDTTMPSGTQTGETRAPSGASPVNDGSVQPVAPTSGLGIGAGATPLLT